MSVIYQNQVVGATILDEELYDSTPKMNGIASPGTSSRASHGDHVHPSDTSRVPVNGMGENLLRNWYFVNPVN